MKLCARCKTVKDGKEFGRRKDRPELLRSYCHSCEAEYMRADKYRASRRTRAVTVERDQRCAYKKKRRENPSVKVTVLLDNAKNRAAAKMLPFDLDHAYIMALLPLGCALTGHSFSFVANSPDAPSIDRLDGFKGYTRDNVRLVTRQANLARNQWSDADLLRFAESVIRTIRSQAPKGEGSETIPKGSRAKRPEAHRASTEVMI